jgi:hypothetical protein
MKLLPARVLFLAPMDTIPRGAEPFSVSLAHCDTVPAGWVCNISQWPVTASVGIEKITIVDTEIFL